MLEISARPRKQAIGRDKAAGPRRDRILRLMKAPREHLARAAGSTLLELMITVAISAILLGIAIPSFSSFVVRSRVTTYSNDLIGTVNYARSEAVRLGTTVSICGSTDQTTCSNSWDSGWIVFINNDGDNPPVIDAGEAILKRYSALTPNYSIGADASVTNGLTFTRDGAAVNTGLFAICHSNTLTDSRAVVITRLRPRVARDTDNDKIPNRDDTSNISSCASPGA